MKKGVKFDYKQAYNKNLKPSARLHYLENARHDQDSPATKLAGLSGAASILAFKASGSLS